MEDITKRCSGCRERKPFEDFGRDNSRANGKSIYCKLCSRERNRTAYYNNNGRQKVVKRMWKKRLKDLGLSPEIYYLMYEQQQGVCAICSQPSDIRLAVDHCHTTGKVRSLLCSNCNVGIGFLREDINILHAAIQYLIEHNGGDYHTTHQETAG